jgi:predicted acylesterase/phospholipase RssA
MNVYSNLVLSSGSLYSYSFIGCIKYLNDIGILQNIKTFVGTSGGSIIVFFHVIGFTPDEMYTFTQEHCVGKDFTNIDISSIIGLVSNFGLDDGAELKKILEIALELKGMDKDIKMIDLVKKTGKNIIICASNVTKGIPEYISVDTYPDMPVVTSILMSCAIPIIFMPVKYNNCYYLDGAIIDPFPYKLCESVQLKSKNTICIAVSFNQPQLRTDEDINVWDFFLHVLDTYKFYTFRVPSCTEGYEFVQIKFENIEKGLKVYNMNGMNKEVLDSYIEIGYKSIKSHFKI